VGAHVHQLFCPSKCVVSELCLFGRDVALPALVAAGAARAHAEEDGCAHHCYGPWLHVAQLEDVQPSLGLDLVPCDDVGVASCEVNGCSCYPSRYHGGCDACGDEGWDGDEHGAFFLLDQKGVVDLREEDELALEHLWQSHGSCCCLHLT
jgi:hypothetical protein